jgi:hypothetical protein
MISPLGLLSSFALALISIAPQASEPSRTTEAVLGLECMVLTQSQISTVHPGLKLPSKQHVVVSKIVTERFDSDSNLSVGDILVKVDGKAIKTLDDLTKALSALELPGDVKVEFLDITDGPKPQTKRESVTLKAVAPAAKTDRQSAPGHPGGAAPSRDAAMSPPQVTASYDRFVERTIIRLSGQEIRGAKYAPREFRLSFSGSFEGRAWETRPSVSLVITSADQEWRFMHNDQTLYLIIDGEKPVELPKPYYSTEIGTGRNFCSEYMSWTLPPELFARLQEAKKIECRLWIVEFEMPEPTPAGLKELQRKIDGLAAGNEAKAKPGPQ